MDREKTMRTEHAEIVGALILHGLLLLGLAMYVIQSRIQAQHALENPTPPSNVASENVDPGVHNGTPKRTVQEG